MKSNSASPKPQSEDATSQRKRTRSERAAQRTSASVEVESVPSQEETTSESGLRTSSAPAKRVKTAGLDPPLSRFASKRQ